LSILINELFNPLIVECRICLIYTDFAYIPTHDAGNLYLNKKETDGEIAVDSIFTLQIE